MQQQARISFMRQTSRRMKIAAVVEAVHPKPVNLLVGFSEISLTQAKKLRVHASVSGARLQKRLGWVHEGSEGNGQFGNLRGLRQRISAWRIEKDVWFAVSALTFRESRGLRRASADYALQSSSMLA